MKVFRYLCVLFCLSTLYSGCFNRGPADRSTADPEQVALADSILWYFQHEQFDKIVRHFDDNLKRQLNKEQLAAVWAQLSTQFGGYTSSEFYREDKLTSVGGRVTYQSHFGSQKLYFQLTTGKGNQVTGIFFKPQPN